MMNIPFLDREQSGFIDASSIPGMIEVSEQQLLYDISVGIDILGGEQFIEFGSFFGRSTYCIAEGLRRNPGYDSTQRVHAYDSFGCAERGGFVEHVIAFARPANALHLVERDGRGRVSFLKVFEHFVTRHLQAKSIVPHVSELSLSKPESARSVAFMHIDSPKFYEEFRFILFRFFPLLRPGSVVVFQDFLYPWSAGLIAAVEGLRQSGFISYERTAASSLATRVLKRPTLEEVIEIDLAMEPSRVGPLIAAAIAAVGGIEVDRPDQFVPRLKLAQVQNEWALGNTAGAVAQLTAHLQSSSRLEWSVINDFMEMLGAGFDIRKVYQADRSS
jgi:hypothetical protein